MDRDDVFEAERPRLFGIAYRILGTISDADDILQEVWIRWHDTADVRHPPGWLTTVTTRLCIDRLRSAQRRRETYVGPWLPEPILTGDDPAAQAELADSLMLGFLTVLDRLDPVHRAVFVLREVFDVDYETVARTVDRSPEHCRQIARRARERVRREQPVVDVEPQRRRQLLDAFLAAVTSGDPAALEPLLAEDVVHVSDGGADRHAARRPVSGRSQVARFLTNLASRAIDEVTIDEHQVNGQPGLVVSASGQPFMIVELEFDNDLIRRVHAVLNPTKLAATFAHHRGSA